MSRTRRYFFAWASFVSATVSGCSSPPELAVGHTEQALCTPRAANDQICDGIDTDCDGLIDEDCSGAPITVVMTPGPSANRDNFFGMPWPSDHRKGADGTLLLDGFPKGNNTLHLVQTAINATTPYTKGFGTNSAVYFRLTGDLDQPSLPTPTASTAPDSPVMLVNLGDPADRIPVVVNYRSLAGRARPDHLLTVLPFPGFSLKPNARYATILFDSLPGIRGRVGRAPLLATLESATSAPNLSAAQFTLLKDDFAAVKAYAADHTSFAPQRIVAFATYTTQNVPAELYGSAIHVAFMSDDVLVQHITSLTPLRSCGACNESGSCPPAELEATLDVPTFQTDPTLTWVPFSTCINPFRQNACVTTTGGDIPLSPGGIATNLRWKGGVRARILVPCMRNQPSTGWPILVRADGSGAPYDNVTDIAFWFDNRLVPGATPGGTPAPLPFNHVAISITPYLTGERVDQVFLAKVDQLLAAYGISLDADTRIGFLNYFILNPVYARNNQVQGAVEQYYLQRLLGVLDKATVDPRLRIDPAQIGLPSGSTPFKTNRTLTTISGQSQGSGVAPLAAFGFTNLHMNAGAGAAYETAVHRQTARQIVNLIYGFVLGDFDRYHPAGQLLQTASETGDIVNFAREVRSENTFVTAGDIDGCTVRESTIAFATALERAAKIRAGDTAALFSDASVLKRLTDSLRVLGNAPQPLPASGNLSSGKTGVFLFLPGGHDYKGTTSEAAAFFSDTGKGLVPTIHAPPYLPSEAPFICEPRVESLVE